MESSPKKKRMGEQLMKSNRIVRTIKRRPPARKHPPSFESEPCENTLPPDVHPDDATNSNVATSY
jgi:hypothetical protein